MPNEQQAEAAQTQKPPQAQRPAPEKSGVFAKLFGKRARHASPKEGMFERLHMYAELLSFIALIVATPVALLEFHKHNVESKENNKKERITVAETTYREVDAKYTEFVKLCLDHPRLDCYSVSEDHPDPPLSKDEKLQQKILYSALMDVFEVAYVQYRTNQHDLDQEVKQIFEEQWQGWDTYIRKFLRRPAYCSVYLDIRDEYDTRLVGYMDAIANKCSAPPDQKSRGSP